MKTSDKVLSILRLYSAENPTWTVDAAAKELKLAQTTAYDYFRSLVKAELLAANGQGRYSLGPAVFELEHLLRSSDHLLIAGDPLLKELRSLAPTDVITLLCRFYRMKVMCIAQSGDLSTNREVSYERGRPMPLLRGAASKVILANLERRMLVRFYEKNADEVARQGLGESWEQFRSCLRVIREEEVWVTHGELDEGFVGISAPVFGEDGAVCGSVSYVCLEEKFSRSSAVSNELREKIRQAGRSLSMRLSADDPKVSS